jgi:hypothetical protein
VQAIEFLLKKNADPDRGGHSTKYDQAKNKKSRNLVPFKVWETLQRSKKCISPQTALKTIVHLDLYFLAKLNTFNTRILVNYTN